MVLGIAAFKWDNVLGAVLDIKHPKEFEIDDMFVNKILMAHSIEQDDIRTGSEDFIELEFGEKIVFSFWKNLETSRGYELIILLLPLEEKVRKPELKSNYLDFARNVLDTPIGDERNDYFFKNVKRFFIDSREGKTLIIGRENSGKTCIKQVVFEGKEPSLLLESSILPTRGLRPSQYSWMDLELSVFDAAGQNINEYLTERKKQIKAFAKANFVIYVFDYSRWVNQNDIIIQDIKAIQEIIEDVSSELVLFLHKIDLIKENQIEILDEINLKIKSEFGLKIYFTSIVPDLLYSLYYAFYEILSQLSKEAFILRELLEANTEDLSNSMFLITNSKNNIVVQNMSPDFDFKLINYIHNLTAHINQTFENMKAGDIIEHFTLQTKDNFNIIMRNISQPEKHDLKNIVGISGSLNPSKLIIMLGDITKIIQNYYIK